MLRTLFDRDDLPPQDRLAALNDLFLTSEHTMGVLSGDAEGFSASVRGVDLAAVNVVELTMSPGRVVRSEKMVRQGDPELVCVALAASGSVLMSQAGRDALLGPGDIAFYDSSRPFEIRFGARGGEGATLIRAHVPRALLSGSGDFVEPLLARPLPGRDGFAGMFVHLMNGLAGDARAYRPGDRHRLAEVAADLLTALVAHHLDAEPVPGDAGDDSRRPALLLSVEAFVRRNLNDPELSPRTIASAHHLSVGHLHRLFSARGTTLTAWIRGLRLKHAGRDLRNPELRDVTVHQIAVRWGFRDHSTFTRSFRAAYGMSPRDYRHASSNQW
ncbi:helix-turn-helix domain-containing protein [Streptomyces sp. NPDC047803]|uniref:helix-turn-helix domain-containing protein n=1 Tax=unclassified Streptomyces TaxID=2593676 RepID=UPI0033C6F323